MSSNIHVGSTVTLNQSVCDMLTREQYRSLGETADAILTDARDNQVMPFDTGNMQNDSTFVDDSQKANGRVSIVTTAPQARRLYFHPEFDFRRTHNPSAGGKWWESYISGSNSNRVLEIYSRLFRQNGGL